MNFRDRRSGDLVFSLRHPLSWMSAVAALLAPALGLGQMTQAQAVGSAQDAFKSEYQKEKPIPYHPSDFRPITFTADLTVEGAGDLVVMIGDDDYHVGLMMLSLFRNVAGRYELIHREKSFGIDARPLPWGRHQGLLIADEAFNDGITTSTADLWAWNGKALVNVLSFPFSTALMQQGYLMYSQVLPGTDDGFQIVRYENPLKYKDGQPTCTTAFLQPFKWDGSDFKFIEGPGNSLTAQAVDSLLGDDGVDYPSEVTPMCGGDGSDTQ